MATLFKVNMSFTLISDDKDKLTALTLMIVESLHEKANGENIVVSRLTFDYNNPKDT